MPITSSDIQQRLSGGGANTDPNAALGGAKSSTQITDNTLHNLFDKVTGDESAAGDTEYRCFYLHNAHATLTWEAVKVWIGTQTPSADTSVEIGLGTSAVNGTEQTVANESSAPSGVTFSSPSNKAGGLSIGDIPAGQHKAIWVKRIVSAAAAAVNSDSFVINFEGDTAA